MTPGAGEHPRWMRSFGIALGLHGAVIVLGLWLHRPPAPPEDASMDALLVDLAPAPQAPPAPSSELTPGPFQQQQSDPSPAPAPPKSVPDTPTPPAPPAPVVLEESVEPQPQPQTAQAVSSDSAREAAEAMAPPSVDASPDKTFAAPREMAGNSRAAVESWHGLLLAHLERHRRYPRQAERRAQQGVSYIRFEVDHFGRVVGPRIARSSGHDLLDAEALDTVHRASPVPPPPDVLPGHAETVVVPVEFFLHR